MGESNFNKRILIPGRNCWRIEHANRLSVLIDGEAYFRAVRMALMQAQRSIFILSWDIDSRMRLAPGGANDGLPEPLGDFLHELVTSRKGLHTYLLNWDFAMLYALEREWFPVYNLGWRTHRRLHFHLDGRHPVGASHHQKVVVIDDKLAFVGGLDLTRRRWDTSQHRPVEPLRCDADGKAYSPFHDVQVMLDGNAAAALGELARDRWLRATGSRIDVKSDEGVGAGLHDLWPTAVTPDITDIDVAIARTDPRFEDRKAVEEIRQLHIDAIAQARRHVYFENQYATSEIIANALSTRLAEADAPEVVVVSRRTESGWLEALTMGVLRARLHRRLKLADANDRYRMYYPTIVGQEGKSLNVHSKFMTMDDQLLCLGSANLNNRSMALDNECNIAIEACGNERISHAIGHVRNRLLAEHLATDADVVEAEIYRQGSLIGAIESLNGPRRSLAALEPTVSPEMDALVPDSALIDPEKPITADELIEQLAPRDVGRPILGRVVRLAAFFFVLGLLAVTWKWTPASEWVNFKSLTEFAQRLDEAPFTPIAVILAYVAASLLMMPVTLLIAVTGLVFGPLVGGFYAITGALLSAAAGYALGRRLGHDAVRRFAGQRINRISKRIAKRGIVAMAIIRLAPIAPFTLINVVAGASHIGLRDYLIGTLIGMTPGILVTVTFVHHLVEAMQEPSLTAFSVLAIVAGVLIGIAIVVERYLGSKEVAKPGAQSA